MSAVSDTALATVAWREGDKVQIRTYYQDAKHVVHENAYEGSGWAQSQMRADAIPGTALAATSWLVDNKIHIRVYYQKNDYVLAEHCYDSDGKGWYVGAFSIEAVPNTKVSVGSWMPSGNRPELRVYFETKEGVREGCYGQELKWNYNGGGSIPT